jgi:hypothetical protein
LLFASDCPWMDQGEELGSAAIALSDGCRQGKDLSSNAARLLGLEG